MQTLLNTTTHSVAWFAARHRAEQLELKPPFQRNPVWTDKQKSYLIDTILRGYPIPELYMQEYTDAAGNERYVVVDGQQRLRACLEFIEGRFMLDPTDSPDFADMSFEDLSPERKKLLFGYNLVVRVLPDMPDPELRAMFTRLNRNVVALNSQELRHATYWGEFISSMEKIADDESWTSLGVFTPNDDRRMLDVEFISELAIAYLHGLQNKKEHVDEWYQAYEQNFERRMEVEHVFGSALLEVSSVFPDLERTRWRKKSDFYSLFLVMMRASEITPFSRDGRAELRTLLVTFGTQVSAYLAEPSSSADKAVMQYARAVERAASDVQNRRDRQEALKGLLEPLFARERDAQRRSQAA